MPPFRSLSPEQIALLEHCPHPVLVLDDVYRIRYINPAAARMGGVAFESLVGEHVWTHYPELEGSVFHRAYATVMAEGRMQSFEEYRPVAKRWVSVLAYPCEGGVVAMLEDITARRHAELELVESRRALEERSRFEAQMQQAQKLESLGVLAGGIAHDFNNLLVGILGNASLALLDLEHQSEARRSVEEIEQAAQRAAELTRQLLAYAGKGRFVVEVVDASTIVQEMATLLRTAVSKSAAVQLDLEPGLPRIEVDATQFRQVVMNLITNASDAITGGPGAIVIRTGRATITEAGLPHAVPGTHALPGDYVVVEVRDTGVGMDETAVTRIFDPFYSTKFTGRGLGLAATLGIVRGHRGAIETISAPDVGTTMRLYFPVSTRRKVASEPRPPHGWTGSGEVLIVDDEESVRSVSAALLRRRGFEVVIATDGHEAVGALADRPDRFTFVLLDLTMPGMDGEATFLALRALDPALRVILMSGYSESEVTRMFEGHDIAGFLQKPFRAEELYDVVGRSLGLRE